MEWSSDLVWRTGGRPGSIPDSRKVTFFGHVGKAFSLIFTHIGPCWETLWRHFLGGSGSIFEIFGMSWDVSGSGLATFLDRFGKVLEKCPAGSENHFYFMLGSDSSYGK